MDKFDRQLNAVFSKIDRKIDKLPKIIGETALEHFQNAITKRQWDGKPYAPYKGKEPTRGNLMRRTGALFSSIKIISQNADSIIISAGGRDVPYAKVHNEGGTIQYPPRTTIVAHKQYKRGKFKGRTLFARNDHRATYAQRASVGAYSVNMPRRQFMGKSPSLLADIKNRIKTNFKTL